ncbi:MAG: hypothetical protein AAGM45_17810 [Cyanobacteria bacterium J06588_5]
MSEPSQPRYRVESVFMSSRGLHFCFRTRVEAETAYQGGLQLGRTNLTLEGAQMIAARSRSSQATPETPT